MMLTEADRERIRVVHQSSDERCVVCKQKWPCDAKLTFDELLVAEAQARMLHEQVEALRAEVELLGSKIRDAIGHLS